MYNLFAMKKEEEKKDMCDVANVMGIIPERASLMEFDVVLVNWDKLEAA